MRLPPMAVLITAGLACGRFESGVVEFPRMPPDLPSAAGHEKHKRARGPMSQSKRRRRSKWSK